MLLTPWWSFGTLGRRGEVAERRLLVESELERSSNGDGARVCWRGRRELEGIQGRVCGTLNRGGQGPWYARQEGYADACGTRTRGSPGSARGRGRARRAGPACRPGERWEGASGWAERKKNWAGGKEKKEKGPG